MLTPDIGELGEVIYSVLPEAVFQKLYGKGWVLMDGREIIGSALYKLTKDEGQEMKCIPNGIDMFIRGKSEKRDIGSFQDDATRMPRTRPFTGVTSTDGDHNHKLGYKGHCLKNSDHRNDVNLETTGWFGEKYTHNNGSHKHSVTISGGDPETRPKNIALYIYIKIN